VIVVY